MAPGCGGRKEDVSPAVSRGACGGTCTSGKEVLWSGPHGLGSVCLWSSQPLWQEINMLLHPWLGDSHRRGAGGGGAQALQSQDRAVRVRLT